MAEASALSSFLETPDEIGVDESGRGTFFGPVYAGAVIWNPEREADAPPFLNDSKKMTRAQRQAARTWIETNVLAFGVGSASTQEVDQMNILNATGLAMQRAIDALVATIEVTGPRRLIIDGTRWEGKFGLAGVRSVIGGDAKFYSIAAASILAKEYHDDHIRRLCEEHPEWHAKYDLLNNMGYGTAAHIDGLRTHGVTEEHRFSVRMVQQFAG